jgi:hypothetical protein
MNKKPNTAPAAKVSISVDAETLEWIEANKAIFGSVSKAFSRGIDALKADVSKRPDAYTIRPVQPKRVK